jgi:hypothetical protein
MTHSQPVVYRQLALPVSTFDRIKDFQRAPMSRHGEHLTIAQTITAIVREQQLNEEREEHDTTSKQPAALLKP